MLHHKLLSPFDIPRLREPVFFDQGRTVFVGAMVHYWDFWEVAVWRGAGGGDPFQRIAFPGVLRGFFAPDPATDEVDREEDLRDPQAQGTDGDELVHRLEMCKRHVVAHVIGDASRH